jgi:hypothetical protein
VREVRGNQLKERPASCSRRNGASGLPRARQTLRLQPGSIRETQPLNSRSRLTLLELQHDQFNRAVGLRCMRHRTHIQDGWPAANVTVWSSAPSVVTFSATSSSATLRRPSLAFRDAFTLNEMSTPTLLCRPLSRLFNLCVPQRGWRE